MTPYQILMNDLRETRTLGSVAAVVEWDSLTYLPSGATMARANQEALISRLVHERETSPRYKKLLSNLIDLKTGKIKNPKASTKEKIVLAELHRRYRINHSQPAEFVETFKKATSLGYQAWAMAKKENNYKAFEPHLKKIIELSKRRANYIDKKKNPYDVLLDIYEKGLTSARISAIFDPLKSETRDLLKTIQTSQAIDDRRLKGHYPESAQHALALDIMKRMGLEPEYVRLDRSPHPFCTQFHPTDVRITTRYKEENFANSLFSVMHESGHAMYERGLPESEFGSPLGEAMGMTIHESQSRLWENMVGRSLPFWEGNWDVVKKHFPDLSLSVADFHRAINRVSPGLIRTEADEVTYNLHIAIRFDLERAIFDGSLKFKDIPDAWNAAYDQYLGIRPDSVSTGVMQDVHWPSGLMGYFPSYALGNLCAAMFYETFLEQHPHFTDELRSGNSSSLKTWLGDSIHRHGQRYTSEELVERVTGHPLSHEAFIRYLRKKYSHLISS